MKRSSSLKRKALFSLEIVFYFFNKEGIFSLRGSDFSEKASDKNFARNILKSLQTLKQKDRLCFETMAASNHFR